MKVLGSKNVRSLISSILVACILGTTSVADAQAPHLSFIDTELGAPVSEVLIGRAVAIRVTGLPPEAKVELNCGNLSSQATATFKAQADGSVDLSRQAPLRGSYSGVDVDGMFWSREWKPEISRKTPPGPFHCQALIKGTLVAEAHLTQLHSLPGVTQTRLRLGEVGFEGLLALPEGDGPFPALILLGGSEGGLDTRTPQYYASQGYAALSVAYHAHEDLPPLINRIPLEYFKTSIEWLKRHPKVQANRIGIQGISRGGELALLLASVYDDFKSVMALVPSGVAWAGNYDAQKGTFSSSWTYGGKDVPFLSFTFMAPKEETLPDGRKVYSFTPIFLKSLEDKRAVEAATIAAEKIKAPVLILSGKDDQVWPSCDLSEIVQRRRANASKSHDDMIVCYPDAGHGIHIPGQPLTDLAVYHPVMKGYINFGGTPEGTARAQRDGWNKVLEFLKRTL